MTVVRVEQAGRVRRPAAAADRVPPSRGVRQAGRGPEGRGAEECRGEAAGAAELEGRRHNDSTASSGDNSNDSASSSGSSASPWRRWRRTTCAKLKLEQRGALVTDVKAGGPGELVNPDHGGPDVILEVEGTTIRSPADTAQGDLRREDRDDGRPCVCRCADADPAGGASSSGSSRRGVARCSLAYPGHADETKGACLRACPLCLGGTRAQLSVLSTVSAVSGPGPSSDRTTDRAELSAASGAEPPPAAAGARARRARTTWGRRRPRRSRPTPGGCRPCAGSDATRARARARPPPGPGLLPAGCRTRRARPLGGRIGRRQSGERARQGKMERKRQRPTGAASQHRIVLGRPQRVLQPAAGGHRLAEVRRSALAGPRRPR